MYQKLVPEDAGKPEARVLVPDAAFAQAGTLI